MVFQQDELHPVGQGEFRDALLDGVRVEVRREEDSRGAKAEGREPLAKIVAYAQAGVDPAYMGLGPVPAVRRALKMANMTIKDLKMVEVNEAFASQAIGCFREFGLDNEFPNQLGSGISRGHPIGCTGARMVVTAMYQMKRANLATSVVTMCIGGGMGMAMILER